MAKSSKRIIAILALLATLAGLVVYTIVFGKTTAESGVQLAEEAEDSCTVQDALDEANALAQAAKTAYESQTATEITLADAASRSSGSSVQIEENAITLTAAGIYRLSGTLSDGQVIVDTDGAVALILDGVEIANRTDAAICVQDAAQLLIYLPESSENTLCSGTAQEITEAAADGETDNGEGAALYARDNLSFAGEGALTVGGYINNGVATTDRLTVLGGELHITAVNNGLKGKDSVLIVDGLLNITSGNDGIKSNNDTDSGCGTVEICDGTVYITAFGDGVQAAQDLTVASGSFHITTGDITQNTAAQGETPGNMQEARNEAASMSTPELPDGADATVTPPELPDGADATVTLPELPDGADATVTPPELPDGADATVTPPELPDDAQSQATAPSANGGAGTKPQNPGGGEQQDRNGGFADIFSQEEGGTAASDTSTKAFKSGGNLTITGGSFTVTSAEDCLHADANVTLGGGTLTLTSGDDGIHAGDTLTLDGADITVTQSYEGLEAHNICVNSGNISVTASDDGLNANGGASMFGAVFSGSGDTDDTTPCLRVTGGTLYVNAGGDGLDSNGDLIIDGGTVIVDGPSDDGNGALDSGTENGGSILCNGGTVLAIGGSGMAESFEEGSSQPSFIYNFESSLAAGSEITITDASGEVIFTHTAAKTFRSVVFSSAELAVGSCVTVTVGDRTAEISIDGISNGNASGGFSGMGGFKG